MALGSLPRGVLILGFVSLFMDVSSEMIHSLLPIFLVGVIGASALSVGIIEGVAEATALFTRIFSGAISDRIGRRKPLILLGYGLGALSKPLFPPASDVVTVLFARFVDRIGKGIRGAPRDAMVADLAPAGLRGAAYGLRQSMDTIGAFSGPLPAMLLMWLSGDDFRLVFWVAVVPGLIAVLLIATCVKDAELPREAAPVDRRFPLRRSEIASLGRTFWLATAVAAVLTLGRFSEAFLLLRADNLGLAKTLIPLVLIVMNLVYAASASPLGSLSDRLGRRGMLAFGLVLLIAADLVLAGAQGLAAVFAGTALWGLHMGATQGLLAAMVADAAPARLRATAFGVFYLVSGLALLVASVAAGALWTWLGPAWTFAAGAAVGLVALLCLAATWRRLSAPSDA